MVVVVEEISWLGGAADTVYLQRRSLECMLRIIFFMVVISANDAVFQSSGRVPNLVVEEPLAFSVDLKMCVAVMRGDRY